MEWLTIAGTTIIVSSVTYGYYMLNQKDKPVIMELDKIESIFSKSDQSPKQKITKIIDETEKTLDIGIFLLTENDFVTHICKATKRGVNVRMITDRKQTSELSKQTANVQKLIESGVPVKVNQHDGNMHLKVMISDKKLTTSGSYNFTYSAEEKNDEVLVVIKSKKMGEEWTDKFNQMWKDSSEYNPSRADEKLA
ncbi:phospholipase D-like domain-containing protein [Halobacillus seohaensis]|uniref:phospholipase D n=1 Tax=Halobacillus seohaensis TaxID=447421 RepID=A0ABW2ELR4_9BACI